MFYLCFARADLFAGMSMVSVNVDGLLDKYEELYEKPRNIRKRIQGEGQHSLIQNGIIFVFSYHVYNSLICVALL